MWIKNKQYLIKSQNAKPWLKTILSWIKKDLKENQYPLRFCDRRCRTQ